MAIQVALHHRTAYTYDRLVGLGPQVIRLRPAPHCRTPIKAYSLRLQPDGHFLNWQQDPHGNFLARVVYPDKVTSLEVVVDLVAELAVQNPFDFFLEPAVESFPFAYDDTLANDLAVYRRAAPPGPLLQAFLDSVPRTPRRTVDFLVDLNRRLSQEIKYVIRLEPGIWTAEEVLERRSGSCRDTGWLLVQALRHLGFASRFVSGYLIQLKPDVKPLEGPAGATEDFTDLHAWAEVYLPGAGWVGLDPTSGLFAGEGHLPLAATPEPSLAAPISGSVDECETAFSFEMSVRRVAETPRVTLPYSEAQWGAIDALGRAIDERLRRGDVRLTMGGEPTFVSVDDPDGPEWNTAALGENKRRLADQLIRRLWQRFGPGGYLHHGQGKWYPGESLPRWAFSTVWRRDGEPIWSRPEYLDDLGSRHGYAQAEAERFIRALTEALGITDRHVLPAYEDAFYYLWKERRLPTNVDPLDSRLEDPEERARLARVFEQGLDYVVGYALPLTRSWGASGPEWTTGPWFLRPERMYLIPGDSPMGFRLPLDSLPWVSASDYPYLYHSDPTSDLPPLPTRIGDRPQMTLPRSLGPTGRPPGRPDRPSLAPRPGESAAWITRTALCVEPRAGHLHIFLPPVQRTEDYLEILTAVETTAAHLDMPVILEGYPVPFDYRLESIKVTPDPGVIEVNVHPSASWDHLVEKTTVLYDLARECRLGTEKFMLDGRHTGTGGGNHILIGGARPSDSPILRRPHLLKSLLAYWQHHPALSYLFSGLFIGPTSQAPRIDEARQDSLYELEVAFREIARLPAENPLPWQVDRILRHLLVDSTGNTHRSEFCIDKLYSPESAAGRLGLLELRSFEMPPHSRMSLAQHLLLRGLVAKFWEQPYAAADRLVRWGTEIHDRWMLPHFIWRDLEEVVADLASSGMPFQADWFAPHLEFRFPVHGAVTHRDIEIELRQALEPWHVLGEQAGAGGTVRYVDSSVERLQVRVRGLTPGRFAIACNGTPLPLRPTGTRGEFVAGVRYRAWQPPECLHPTVGVDTPLRFDLLDRWNQRSLGGCTYHVAHPGSRGHQTFPINSYEAEGRRLARFEDRGHSPGHPLPIPPLEETPEAPYTLDLRDPQRQRLF